MPFCSQCGNQVPDNAQFCRSCGAQQQPTAPPRRPQASPPPAAPPFPTAQASDPAQGSSFFQRPVVKWGGIGCGGLFLLFILLSVFGAIFGSGTEDSTDTSDSSSGSTADPTAAARPTTAPSAEPTATLTPDPVADLHFCDHPPSLEFLQAQNELVARNNKRLEVLGLDFFALFILPLSAQDDGWHRNVLADVDMLDAAGKRLAEAGPVPAPAADLNRQFQGVGSQMSRVASLMSKTANDARADPWPISKWEPIAEDLGDALNDLADDIEDVQKKVLDECG